MYRFPVKSPAHRIKNNNKKNQTRRPRRKSAESTEPGVKSEDSIKYNEVNKRTDSDENQTRREPTDPTAIHIYI